MGMVKKKGEGEVSFLRDEPIKFLDCMCIRVKGLRCGCTWLHFARAQGGSFWTLFRCLGCKVHHRRPE